MTIPAVHGDVESAPSPARVRRFGLERASPVLLIAALVVLWAAS